MSYFLVMTFKVFPKGEILGKAFPYSLRIYSAIYVIANFILLKPAETVYFGPFVDWQEHTQLVLVGIEWLLTVSALLGMVLIFSINGWSHEDSLIRKRSRAYAAGFAITLVGWLSVLCFTVLSPGKNVFAGTGTIGCIIITVGMACILIGTLSRSAESDEPTV